MCDVVGAQVVHVRGVGGAITKVGVGDKIGVFQSACSPVIHDCDVNVEERVRSDVRARTV